ncbi:cupin domain-containing protein [Geopsychrobacter electrodiphilus]|uniref:cupin domain-containing protein n=1 Tax=Geopsychrobacter electrodiphilus TaxID=225196 RepID=UPI00036195BB|nr:cupin domain-containing protein [Geopsychrobacter electrodiphilus]
MSRLIDTNAQDWQPVRPELTRGVGGKLLLDGAMRMVLTRVVPGGNFPPHRDAYGHLFHFLSGAGTVIIGDKRIVVGEGICLQIDAGELHGYENNGSEDLLLISVNRENS